MSFFHIWLIKKWATWHYSMFITFPNATLLCEYAEIFPETKRWNVWSQYDLRTGTIHKPHTMFWANWKTWQAIYFQIYRKFNQLIASLVCVFALIFAFCTHSYLKTKTTIEWPSFDQPTHRFDISKYNSN